MKISEQETFIYTLLHVSGSRSQANRRVRGMMMSGKQFSLDSRWRLHE